MKKLLLLGFFWPCALLAQGQIFPAGTLYGSGPVTVYPEGFVAAPGQELVLNGGREAVLDGPATLVVTDRVGPSVNVDVNVIVTPAQAVEPSARALVLCIGESTCGLVNANPYTGSFSQGWNWASMLRYLALEDGVDIRCLGTESLPGTSLDACYTAHGGWSAYTYLNWPVAAKMDPGAAPSFLHADAMWEGLGLDKVTGKPYGGELWQHDLMARTPYGKYPPSREIASEGVNEFFSVEGGFSLETYLERYRTLDDRGDVLPAVGPNPAGEEVWGRDGKRYKVGSRITSQALLARIKVCRPTHVVLNIGINDGDSACSVEAASEGLAELMERFGDVPVALFVNRWPGVCRRELWEGYEPRQYGMNGNNTRVEAIFSLLGEWISTRENRYLLDVWHTQFPASQHEEKLLPDGRLDCSVNDVHLGYFGQLSAAHQVQGWLYWLLRKR
ncbi:MAG TPA: hypothetical protein DCF48_05190 [Rikenellaceae bacterium]|nr:hypothetical protein [Rikenellaceae bacterium]